MVVSTDLPLPEAALVLLPIAHKQLAHLELKNTSLQPPPATDHKSRDQFSLIRKKIKSITSTNPKPNKLTTV
jgi:hypothetical protein